MGGNFTVKQIIFYVIAFKWALFDNLYAPKQDSIYGWQVTSIITGRPNQVKCKITEHSIYRTLSTYE